MELLLEPLSHAFMVKALMISALVGGVCGLLSCFMTLKGWALMGDAVSHAVLPGVVVAYALGLPFSLGAFVFGVGSVAAIGFVKQKSRVKEDTVIGLVFTGFFALGLVLVSKTRSNIDLTHILFGNVLGISAGDVQQTLVISVLVLVLLLLFRRDLMLFCFDPTHARSIGINTGLLHYMLLGLLSLAAVAGLQTGNGGQGEESQQHVVQESGVDPDRSGMGGIEAEEHQVPPEQQQQHQHQHRNHQGLLHVPR